MGDIANWKLLKLLRSTRRNKTERRALMMFDHQRSADCRWNLAEFGQTEFAVIYRRKLAEISPEDVGKPT